jgi:hypothetical protein
MSNRCLGADSERTRLTRSQWRHIISLLVPAVLDLLNRRHHRRYPLSGNVVLSMRRETDRGEVRGSLCNVSESGIMVTAEHAIPVGVHITLLIDFTGKPMHSHGCIRHFTRSAECYKPGIELDSQDTVPTTADVS